IAFRLRLRTDEDLSGLRLAVRRGDESFADIPGSSFAAEEGGCCVYVSGLVLDQLRDPFFFTVFRGDTPVSDTLSYSVVSYAYSKHDSGYPGLADLVEKLIKCGDSAAAYKQLQ
ncbi:MAG: hypothetical protein II697_04090, partial [Clostridia bacterium]|nr:hypothetical protein [Clostridia bacterium]